MADRLYLDAPSMVYRAFFALPQTLKDAAGRPVNAVRGFMDMVAWLVRERRPADVVAVFDADWRPAFRVEAYAGYKAERPQEPPELTRQFDIVDEVLHAAGVGRAEAPGLEAEDAIATLLEAKDAAERAFVVTGDRDLFAVVRDPDVKVLFIAGGMRNLEEFGEQEVREKFGILPDQYPDFASLRGDPSDGLPGVPGIGPVRAAALLREFGSIERIMSNLDRLPAKQAASLIEAADYLAAVKRVVALVRDAEVRKTKPGPVDEAAIKRLADEHNLGGASTRLLQSLRAAR